ncbi:MAG: histone deacetylase [Candidatus Latescibacterota bacterium]|nr:MAG: histone deacetylase [Candidatus Latescibacterota bacterium]
MLKTGYVLDKRYQNHINPPGHPERSERIAALLDLMKNYKREGLVRVEPRPATVDELESTHDRQHIDRVAATAEKEHFVFDLDTHASSRSYETALLSTGGLLALIDSVMKGDIDNGFALVRPPGHHAERDRAMGFCLFNNVAVAARYLKNQYDLSRILIMDWDVHHGNGTQNSFYDDDSVLYVSTHEYPHYPGTGALDELGTKKGLGYTVNLPFPPGYGDEEYIEAFHRIVEPVARQFDPDFVLISAGFDGHELDPLSQIRLTTKGFSAMTGSLLSVARDHAGGRMAAVIEGGYHLDAMTESVACVLDRLGEQGRDEEPVGRGETCFAVSAVRNIQQQFWKL